MLGNLAKYRESRWTRAGVAVGAVGLAMALRWGLVAACGELQVYLLLFPAVCAVAMLAGTGAAVLAMLLAVVGAVWIPSGRGQIHLERPGDLLATAVFILGGGLVSALGGKLRRTRKRLSLAAQRRGQRETRLMHERAAAEAALRSSEQKYRILFDRSPDGIFAVDAGGRFIMANAACEEICGYALAELTQKTFMDLCAPDQLANTVVSFRRNLVERQVLELETALIHKSGRRVELWILGGPVIQRQGEVEIHCTVRDITDRKHQQRETQQALSLLRATLESTADGLLVVDGKGKITQINQQFIRLWQIPQEIADSRDDETALAAAIEQLGDPEAFMAKVRHLYAHPQETSEDIIEFKDGRVFERYSQPQWIDGKPVGRVWSFRDVTSRLQSDAALRVSQQQALANLGRVELLAETAGALLRSLEPQKVIEALCLRVMDHLDCHAFFNFLVDRGRLHLNASAGIPDDEARKIEWLDFGVAVCGCVARDSCRIVAEHIPTSNDPRTELVKGYGIKAYACHPLIGAAGETMGTISFGTRSRETFSDGDLSLMKAVADHVAVAMARMRAEESLELDLESMRRLHRLGSLFVRSGELGPTLKEIVDAAVSIGGAALGNIALMEINGAPRLVAHHGFPDWWIEFWNSIAAGEQTCGELLSRGGRLIVDEIERSAIFAGTLALEMLRNAGIRSVVTTPLMGRAGNLLGTVSTFYRVAGRPEERVLRLLELLASQSADIVERVQIEEALLAAKNAAEQARGVAEHASKAKDQFIAVLSHELRTPLMPATMALSMLELDPRLPADVREDLGMISRNIALEVRLIADLLDVSRIISGKLHMERRAMDVADAIRETARIVASDLDARSQTLVVETPDAPYVTRADAARLQQVFWNLLRNSIKFSPTGSRIILRARLTKLEHCPLAGEPACQGLSDCEYSAQNANIDAKPREQNLVVEVIDQGSGIEADMLPRLFNAFEQEKKARAFGGLGLGLSICKAVVELHGGTISAYSAGAGCGTTFTVRLPVAQCEKPCLVMPQSRQAGGVAMQDSGDAAVTHRERKSPKSGGRVLTTDYSENIDKN